MSSLVRYALPRPLRKHHTRPSFAVGVESISVTLDTAALTLTGRDVTVLTGAITIVVDSALLGLDPQAPTQLFEGSGASSTAVDVATLVLAGQDLLVEVGLPVAAGDVVTLTGDLNDILGNDLTHVRAYLIPADPAVSAAGQVRLGSLRLTLTSGLSFTVTNLPVGDYRLRVTYRSSLADRLEWTSPQFTVTTNSDIGSLL